MVQKGRGYPAAIPRGNLPEAAYNSRCPRSLSPMGSFGYLFASVVMGGTDWNVNYHYTGLPLVWHWDGIIDQGLLLFNYKFEMAPRQDLPGGRWEGILTIDDNVHVATATWIVDVHSQPWVSNQWGHFTPDVINFFPPFHWDTTIGLWMRARTYAEF
jgi:hypothetical protein